MTKGGTRAAIYARYSSTLQDARSVEDQVRLCQQRAAQEGWTVDNDAVFADFAISGSIRHRPALDAMLARAGEFDILISEALDRVSRHQADIASIYETLTFNDCRLVTLSEGDVSELHIGLKGTMAALFRKDLADKIRRGQRGRVAAGRVPGNVCYGYRKVIALRSDGTGETGLREVDPDQAAIVKRIYAEYLKGLSPRLIAQRLNADGVPSPSGRLWAVSMINGDQVRRNGILQNEIYVGRLIYGRTKMVRDPVTRKRVPRVQPESDWEVREIPNLQIVDIETWEAVRAIRARRSNWTFAMQKRPKRLLSGLVACGQCGGSYVVIGSEKWGCGAARTKGTCDNRRTIETSTLENRVLAGLQARLLHPDLVRLFVREYHAEYARATAEGAKRAAETQKKIEALDQRVERLVNAIAEGAGAVPEVIAALEKARAERLALKREVEDSSAKGVIALHPGIAEEYQRNVTALANALANDPEAQMEAVPAVRSLIDRVTLTPRAAARGVDIEVFGRMANALALATGEPLEALDDSERMLPMVAEARYRRWHTSEDQDQFLRFCA